MRRKKDKFTDLHSTIASCCGNTCPTSGQMTITSPSFGQRDYDIQRPHEMVPKYHHDIMCEVDRVYKEHGTIRNVIDLITDFVVAGVNIDHPTPSVQDLYRNWAERSGFYDACSQLAHSLALFGQGFVETRYTDFDLSIRTDLRTSKADIEFESGLNGLPSGYTFLNPKIIDLVGTSGVANTKREYGVKLSIHLQNIIKNPLTEQQKKFVLSLPQSIVRKIRDSRQSIDAIPLNKEIDDYFYKKMDWDLWATPIIYSILRSVKILEKAQLADQVALEAATDKVRIWKLGDPNVDFYPDQPAFDRLSEAIQTNVGASIRDIVWTWDIDLLESKTDTADFLGDDKYKPVLREIYAGMGISPTLTGSAEGTSGTTNNLVSLKTLVSRLSYIRRKVMDFANKQFQQIKDVVGHRKHAVLTFDHINFDDEAAIKKLYIELADRNIISHETLRKLFDQSDQIEESRVNREEKKRDNHKIPPKASPYHNAQYEEQCIKDLVNSGNLPMESLNLPLDLEDEDVNFINNLNNINGPNTETSNQDPQLVNRGGRPVNSRDSFPRTRRFTPVTRANKIKTAELFERITNLLNPAILNLYNKKNMRSLDSQEFAEANLIKVETLFKLDHDNLEPTDKEIAEASVKDLGEKQKIMKLNYLADVVNISKELDRELTLAEKTDVAIESFLGVG